MHGGDHCYPGVQFSAWKITEDRLHRRNFPSKYLKLVTTPIGQLKPWQLSIV